MKKKQEDIIPKIIWSLIIGFVLFVFDWFMLNNLGQESVPAHRQEFLGQLFTGSVWDWVGFSLFNAFTIVGGVGIWGGFEISEEENTARIGKYWVALLALSIAVIAVF